MKSIWKWPCVIACLIIGLSVVLPYYSASGLGVTVSKSLMDGNDWSIIVIISAVALVLSLFRRYLLAAFLGMASLGVFIWEKDAAITTLGKEIDTLARSMIQNGAGYYLLLVGSFALLAFSVLGLAERSRK